MFPGQFVIAVRIMAAVVIVMIVVTGTARHSEAAELDGSAVAQWRGHVSGRNEQAASQRRKHDERQ